MTTTLPDMSPVESSNIDKIGYSGQDRKMFIRFKSGGVYQYDDVPEVAHKAFMAAPSKGSHFRAAFAGKYKHTKVE